jgi:hypothetical protein
VRPGGLVIVDDRRLRGTGAIAVLRRPAERPDWRDWSRFVSFT